MKTLLRGLVWVALLVICGAGYAEPLYPSLAEASDTFYFVMNADPQIGPADSPHANERRLQQMLADFVVEVNAMTPPPAFVVFNGDLVAFPRENFFASFNSTVQALDPPIVLVHGNHDGRYPDTQFYDSQELLSGFRKGWYAFDCGQWRFIALPCPELLEGNRFSDEVIPWLDEELAAHEDRPVMVFLHYHLLPTGLTQSEYYTLPHRVKTELVETLVRRGNVRYVISGHVHAGIQSSIKTSWTYRDAHFIIAPSPVAPRNFGEEFSVFRGAGEPDEGYYLIIRIDGRDVTLVGRKTGNDVEHIYPDTYPEFSAAADPRALQIISAMTPAPTLVNGDFESGFDGWLFPHRYQTDVNPSYVRRIADVHTRSGVHAASLRVHEKGHAWAYDEMYEMYQLVAVPEDSTPVVCGSYYSPLSAKSHFGGAYIRLAGYRENAHAFTMVFHWGAREARVRHAPQVWTYHDFGRSRGLPGFHRMAENKEVMFWTVPDYPGGWHDLEVDMAHLYDQVQEEPGAFAALGIDKILVKCGVWCGMESGAFSEAWFDRFSVDFKPTGEAQVDGYALRVSPRTFIPAYGAWYLDGHDK